jgi:hypothetical protein
VAVSLLSFVLGLGGALIWHAIIVWNLSATMGRYRGPGGRVVNSIASHPLHLAGLALIVAAGLLVGITVSEPILPFQIGLAVILATADVFFVFRAIKSVDRFVD